MGDKRDDIALQLGRIGRMERECDEADKQILEAAEHRLGVVNARLEDLRPNAIGDESAGAEYQKLIEERGTLHGLLGQKRISCDVK